jgi:hypothetical protein
MECMRWLLASWILAVSVVAQTAPETPPAPVPSVGTASLEQQRASILKQAQSIIGKEGPPADSFFAVPWIDPLVLRSTPPAVAGCQPMATIELDKLIEQSATQEGVKADLIRAVIGQESGGKPCAVSVKGAQGLMQLMPSTSTQFGMTDPFDPKQNIEGGTKLLKQLLTKYKGDLSLALSAYNAGANRVGPDGVVPPIQETTDYVNAILAKLPKN